MKKIGLDLENVNGRLKKFQRKGFIAGVSITEVVFNEERELTTLFVYFVDDDVALMMKLAFNDCIAFIEDADANDITDIQKQIAALTEGQDGGILHPLIKPHFFPILYDNE